jgi:aldose 1-epimerase
LIPDGTFIDVAGTPFDFNTEKAIGHAFADGFDGYDHNYVFSDFDATIKHQATLKDPKSERSLKLYTDRPCVQIYTANAINVNDPAFKNGVKQAPHCAVCLETQAMPDSINHEGFTNVILKPEEKYDTTTVFVFEN